MSKNGLELMSDYVFYSKYSQKKDNGELETWKEVNKRIYDTHRIKLQKLGLLTSEIETKLQKAEELENKKIILSSQRGRQYAFPNENSGILKCEAKLYNCCSSYLDRIDFFSEAMWLLLCGCGVGYSLHKEYINKLPIVELRNDNIKKVVIEDSIEGWADSIKELIMACYEGYTINFDYSLIREKGALIDGKFKAPGSKPLKKAHDNILKVFNNVEGRKLKSIELHDIVCYIAEAVIAGGVRRSALISLFDKDDIDMLTCKTGNWWEDNPQRAMANNSILTTQVDGFNYTQLKDKMRIIRSNGEPAIVNMVNYNYVCNPLTLAA